MMAVLTISGPWNERDLTLNHWIPAYAGMTRGESEGVGSGRVGQGMSVAGLGRMNLVAQSRPMVDVTRVRWMISMAQLDRKISAAQLWNMIPVARVDHETGVAP